MGKVIEKVKLTSLFDPTKLVEVEAVIDTGATMLVLPQNLVDKLGLRKIREATVKYANNQRQQKSVYAGLLVEIKGRVGSFDVLAEEEGTEPLVGQIVLEELDLVVEPSTRKLIPNPRSPEMPMVEILMATAYNMGFAAHFVRQNASHFAKPRNVVRNCGSEEGSKKMGHLHTDITVRGNKAAIELKKVLIDTGATYTVLPEKILEEVGAARIPGEVEVELGNGQKIKAKAYGVAIKIKEVEAPAISIAFEGAQTVIGVETLESIGLRLDPTTGELEFTRPKGLAYFYWCE